MLEYRPSRLCYYCEKFISTFGGWSVILFIVSVVVYCINIINMLCLYIFHSYMLVLSLVSYMKMLQYCGDL